MSNASEEFAFPCPEDASNWRSWGLTKREHFTGLAMQGLLASWPHDALLRPDLVAGRAVEIADALIATLAVEPWS